MRTEQGYRDLPPRQAMLPPLTEQLGASCQDLIVHGGQVLHLVRVEMPVEVRMRDIRKFHGENTFHSVSAVA